MKLMPPILKFDIVSVALKDDLKAYLFFVLHGFFDVLCVVLFVIRVLDDLNCA